MCFLLLDKKNHKEEENDQYSFYPGYSIESRAIYYAARRLSSELEKIGNQTNYGELQKVYSIWLCMGDDVPDKKAGTANLLELVDRAIIGHEKIPKEHYDLISAIIIRINDKMKSDDATMQLLQILCSRRTGKQQKLAALQKSGISTNEAVEGGIVTVEILGHTSVNITLNRYVHSSFDLKCSNMNKLALPL